MTSPEQQAADEAFEKLPSEDARGKMSVLDLAKLMTIRKEGSAAYIVLSHELNLKIAEKQAWLNRRNIMIAGTFTIIGAIVGAGATAFFSSQATKEIVHCQCGQNCPTAGTTTPSAIINHPPPITPLPAAGVGAPTKSENKQTTANGNPKP